MAFQGKSIPNTWVSKRKRNQLSQKHLQQLIEQGIPLQKKLDISESASILISPDPPQSSWSARSDSGAVHFFPARPTIPLGQRWH